MPKRERHPDASTPRALLHKMPEIRTRVRYVCDFLFDSNLARFADALWLNYTHVYLALYVSSRITPSMLAQIVSRTNVRAEWLLTGAGPMLLDGEDQDVAFRVDGTVNSFFPVFDTQTLPGVPGKPTKPKKARRGFPKTVVGAAQALHSCRVTGKPVCFFLGADAAAHRKAREMSYEFFDKGYVTSMAVSSGCLPFELTKHCDMNFIARSAALNGVGLGEALMRWTASDKKPNSLFHRVFEPARPLTVHTELGETWAHLKSAVRGAEVGAAWGAASYVDCLVFAAHVKLFADRAGGLFVIHGEPTRGARLFLSTITALRAAKLSTPLEHFAVLQIGAAADEIQEQVKSHGGQFYHTPGTYTAAIKDFLHACNAVYDGTISHDNK